MLKQNLKSREGKETVQANSLGKYKFCFSNEMSRVTSKVVVFTVELERTPEKAPPADMAEGK